MCIYIFIYFFSNPQGGRVCKRGVYITLNPRMIIESRTFSNNITIYVSDDKTAPTTPNFIPVQKRNASFKYIYI